MPPKNQKNNHGLSKLSTQNLISKSCSSGSKSETQNKPCEDFDSPYKNSLSKIQRISLNNGEDDFRTPVKKISKKLNQAFPKNKCVNKKKSSSKNLILKCTEDNFKNSDVNPEHIQMALALSNSMITNKHSEIESENTEPDLSSFLNHKPKVTTFLEKYGFKSSKSLKKEDSFNKLEDARKRKNSKFRFITPALYTRSNEKRESLINSRVAELLEEQNNSTNKNTAEYPRSISSTYLKPFVRANICWLTNSCVCSNYICPSLNISPTKSAVGYLLKDWDKIPGRESSQAVDYSEELDGVEQKKSLEIDNDIEIEKIITETNLDQETNDVDVNRFENYSPDLFEESHYDYNSLHSLSSNKSSNSSSELNLSVKVEDIAANLKSPANEMLQVNENEITATSDSVQYLKSNGIEHFESFSEDTDILINKFMETESDLVDLTQSSDEETEIKNNKAPSTSVQASPLEQKKENFKSDLESENETNISHSNRISFTGKNLSSVSEYNSTKSLNITNYVIDILNSQDDYDCIKDDQDITNVEIFSRCQAEYSLDNKAVNCSNDFTIDDHDGNDDDKETEEIDTIQLDNKFDDDCELLSPAISSKNESTSTCSQDSVVILSDEELNYSNRLSAKYHPNFYDLSYLEECITEDIDKDAVEVLHLELKKKYCQVTGNKLDNFDEKTLMVNTPEKSSNVQVIEKSCSKNLVDDATPEKPVVFKNDSVHVNSDKSVSTHSTSAQFSTPKENLIIKTSNVTPMVDYDVMDTPKIISELDKLGIKPLKRQRGIQLLKYIYESTHPLVDDLESEDENKEKPIKRRKLSNTFKNNKRSTINIAGSALTENENKDDLLFERKFSKKYLSCRIPLQIAWYNFLCDNPSLAESIVIYEPIQLEIVQYMLKEQSGCNFHIEDLINFLDKKCITFRTNKWQASRSK